MKLALIAAVWATSAMATDMDSIFPFENEILREWDSSEFPVTSQHGKEALAIHSEAWQHLQASHFILHFSNKGVAVRTAQEAEFYLWSIRAAMGFENDDPKIRSHIFIFENEDDWKQFTRTARLDPWTGGCFDGLDLFYWRKTGMGVLHSNSTLPHEIAHRVLYERFPSATIPLALNEGVAEYEARKLAFRYLRPRGYDVRIISKRVARDKFISAESLIAATAYPQGDENVTAFYDLSERLVNFLVEKHGLPRFLSLLESLSKGERFPIALLRVYSGEYGSLDQFERAFQDYAIDTASR